MSEPNTVGQLDVLTTEDKLAIALAKVTNLKSWVDDLQAGMYINCVYCGHRYGPDSETPASMADVLKEHVERCPEHPMSALRDENERLRDRVAALGTTAGEMIATLRIIMDLTDDGGSAEDLDQWAAVVAGDE